MWPGHLLMMCLEMQPSTAHSSWVDSGQILRHHWWIFVVEAQTSVLRNVPSREKRGETAVFAGYDFLFLPDKAGYLIYT